MNPADHPASGRIARLRLEHQVIPFLTKLRDQTPAVSHSVLQTRMRGFQTMAAHILLGLESDLAEQEHKEAS